MPKTNAERQKAYRERYAVTRNEDHRILLTILQEIRSLRNELRQRYERYVTNALLARARAAPSKEEGSLVLDAESVTLQQAVQNLRVLKPESSLPLSAREHLNGHGFFGDIEKAAEAFRKKEV